MTLKEIAELFVELELHLIESLKRNLLRHKRQEKDEGGKDGVPEHWEAWQSAKLRDVRRFRQENQDILGQYSGTIHTETEKLLMEQYAESGSGGFFRTQDERVRSLVHEMQHNEARVEQAALRYMDDVYRKTILRTATAMTTGGMTLNKAVDEATKDFLSQGINCIRYANGRMVNIASYAEMALRTCSTRAVLLGEAKQRERMGIDTVLVSQYGACSDTCLPWQGKVYIDDVFQEYHGPRGGSFGVSRNGRQYLFLSVAIKAGLFHPNCRHTISTWIEGISTKPRPMNNREIERVNKLEAEQRRLEREVRRAKREAAGLTDPQAVETAKRKLRVRQKALRDFVNKHSDVLRRDLWRERNDVAMATNSAANAPQNAVSEDSDTKLYRNVRDSSGIKSPVPDTPDMKTAPINGEDVSAEYEEQATPGEGEITYDDNYDLKRHSDEVKMAEWIHSKFGGDIRLLQESSVPNVKRPDYLWRGKLWDLKSTSTAKAADSALRSGLKQIFENPGGIILDYGNNNVSFDDVLHAVESRMKRGHYTTADIIVISRGEVVKVLRYRK